MDSAMILRPRVEARTTFIDSRKVALRDLDAATSIPGQPCALDSEFDTNERDRNDKDLVIWSRSRNRGERVVILGEFATSVYADWLQDKRFPKVWSDYRQDEPVFHKLGLDLNPSFHADIVHLDHYRDENEKKHGLKPQVGRLLNRRRQDYAKLFCFVPEGKKKSVVLSPSMIMGWREAPSGAFLKKPREQLLKEFIDYSGDDAEDTILCYYKNRRHLEEIGYWDTYLELDQPFTLTLRAMQPRGILIDKPNMLRVRALAKGDMLRAEHVFRAVTDAPADMNLNSNDQKRALIIDQLGWPEYEDLMTDGGEASISKPALQRWAVDGYKAALLLIERDSKRKLVSDVNGLISGTSEDGRLRSDWKQLGTSTARLASRKWSVLYPFEKVAKRTGVSTIVWKKKQVGANLQNIVTKKEKDPYGIRKGFVAPLAGQMTADGTLAEEDYVLIVADYAGYELVILCHWIAEFCPESPMIKAILKYGTASALHVDTAIKVFKLPVTLDEWMANASLYKAKHKHPYDIAKILNFGLGYGADEYTMTKKREMDVRNPKHIEENRLFVAKWFEGKPEVARYQRRMVKHGYKFGWVPTLAGSRQNVGEGLARESDRERKHWEDKCKNGPIQTSASQIMMKAMNDIECDEELRSWGYRMIKQVHDEIGGEGPKSTAQKSKERVEWHMLQAYKDVLRVPLGVEAQIAANWASAK